MSVPYGSKCGTEGSICTWPPSSSKKNVIYHNNGINYFRDVHGQSLPCTGNTFDVSPNVNAACYVRNTPVYTLDQNGNPVGYIKCSSENGTCKLNQPSNVLYGANGNFVSGVYPGGSEFSCSNNIFGDPAYNSNKNCYYKPIETISTNQVGKCPTYNAVFPGCDQIRSYNKENGGYIIAGVCKDAQGIQHPTYIDVDTCYNSGCDIYNNNGKLACLSNSSPSNYYNQYSNQYSQPNNQSSNLPNGQYLNGTTTNGVPFQFFGWPNVNISSGTLVDLMQQVPSENACASTCASINNCNIYSYNEIDKYCLLQEISPNTRGVSSKVRVNNPTTQY